MQATPIQTFQRWKDAQKALDYAIQHYFESTVALRASIHSRNYPIESLSVRDTLAESWVNAPIPDKDSQLAQAQVHLNLMHNSVLLVNTLPHELLLRIFRFAALSAVHNQPEPMISNSSERVDFKDLLVLTSVCSHWRSILLESASFWSRFELDTRNSIETECQRAGIFLDRARGAPQSLFINERSSRYFQNGDFETILEMIGSRLDDLTQLALLNIPDFELVMQVILHLLKLGKPGVLRTLTIHMETHIQAPEFISTGDAELVEQAASILAPIDSLSLRGVKFAWDSPVYHNLVQLQIGNIPYESSPHVRDILDILFACPLLRMLRISNMTILQGDTTPLEPVYLTQLEHLDLIALTYESLDLLLPLIVPQSKDLSLRITLLAFEDHLASAIHSFLKRTNVTRLFLQQDLIRRCLPAIPDLHALVIDLCEQPGGPCLSEFSYRNGSDDCLIPRCPNLHTLHFYSGSVTVDAVQEIIKIHPRIQKLRFSSCYVDPFEDELRHWLQPYVEDVEFHSTLNDAAIPEWIQYMV
ncbi:hypothetical protein ACGC1H_003458 [Rhizoctonia solani]|uniref:F-box domain-containing protein n=1 Tax=Rhizoctonia solani TaxID=456999 RepID=A0A8H3BYK9_9AGAM|nr:unnamed protein product [Rhizoctonia solani]